MRFRRDVIKNAVNNTFRACASQRVQFPRTNKTAIIFTLIIIITTRRANSRDTIQNKCCLSIEDCLEKAYFSCQYLCAHLLNILLLLSQQSIEIILRADLDIGLTLTLLVLQRTIQQQHTRVLDATSHLGVSDVLVEHNSIQNFALRQFSTGDFLNSIRHNSERKSETMHDRMKKRGQTNKSFNLILPLILHTGSVSVQT